MPGAAHLVLVGLPGAGKSTIGRALAKRLHWPFVDLDDAITATCGLSVPEIFERHGEAHFRRLEREATERLTLEAAQTVVAPGGGWITVPGLVKLVRPPSKLIWLQVSPATALARLGADVAHRPLLAGADPLGAVTALLEARQTFYLQADHTLSIEMMTPSDAVDAILALARR